MCRLLFACSASLPLALSCEGLVPNKPFPQRSRQSISPGTDDRPGRSEARLLHKPDPSRARFPIFSRHSLVLTQEGPPRPNSFVSPSYRDSLVSPLFPLDTKTHGGRGPKPRLTPAHSLKTFKNFQANSLVCRVSNFYQGGGGYTQQEYRPSGCLPPGKQQAAMKTACALRFLCGTSAVSVVKLPVGCPWFDLRTWVLGGPTRSLSSRGPCRAGVHPRAQIRCLLQSGRCRCDFLRACP